MNEIMSMMSITDVYELCTNNCFNDDTIVVYFYSPSCVLCNQSHDGITESIKKARTLMDRNINFVEINEKECQQDILDYFEIKCVPTVIVLINNNKNILSGAKECTKTFEVIRSTSYSMKLDDEF